MLFSSSSLSLADPPDADWDYLFPDDATESNRGAFNLLNMAHMWKKAQASQNQTVPGATGAAPAHPLLANATMENGVKEMDTDAGADGDSDAEMASSNGGD